MAILPRYRYYGPRTVGSTVEAPPLPQPLQSLRREEDPKMSVQPLYLYSPQSLYAFGYFLPLAPATADVVSWARNRKITVAVIFFSQNIPVQERRMNAVKYRDMSPFIMGRQLCQRLTDSGKSVATSLFVRVKWLFNLPINSYDIDDK